MLPCLWSIWIDWARAQAPIGAFEVGAREMRRVFVNGLLIGTLLACGPKPGIGSVDADNDGFDSTMDCDDSNADVNPGA